MSFKRRFYQNASHLMSELCQTCSLILRDMISLLNFFLFSEIRALNVKSEMSNVNEELDRKGKKEEEI